MTDVEEAPTERPYRTAYAATIGSALFAGVGTAIFDVLITLQGAQGVKSGDSYRFFTVALSLYGAAALLLGLMQGTIAGAIRATYPGGATLGVWRRLESDEDLDRRVTGTILASCFTGLIMVIAVAVLSVKLVGTTERKMVGGLLLGAIVVASLPLAALATFPFYRATRHVARLIPRLGPVPATAVLLVFAVGIFASMGTLFVATRLDWRALPIGPGIALGSFAILQAVWLLLAYGPLARLREAVPGRPIILGVVVAMAVLAPVFTLSGSEPSDRAVALLAVESRGARPLVMATRKLFDKDKDGYSTILGGKDCDDSRADVHPGDGVKDVPGNGIDEDCSGDDRKPKATLTPDPEPLPDGGKPATKAEAYDWKGNIVIIAVDTLRADRLGVAGYTRRGGKSITPRMDELARRGVHFTRAYAQAPRTPTSFPSLFTSRFPSEIAWTGLKSNYPKVTDDNVTLFEALHEASFQTYGEASHFYFTDRSNITQGFHEFDNDGALDITGSNTDIAGPRIVPRVAARLKKAAAAKAKFVLFTHLFEPHSTYVPQAGCTLFETERVALFEEKYDCEVAAVDVFVGQVVDAIKDAGLEQDTMIVLVSDHGEGFFAHSYAGQKLGWHGSSLYEEIMRVPMIIVAPGLEARTVDQPVMLVDLAPTLLDAVNGKIPEPFQGRSLVPLMVGEPLAPRAVYAELLAYPSFENPMKMYVTPDGKLKLIQFEKDGTWEVYDLAADPDEKNNLAYDQPELVERLKKEMNDWRDAELD